MTKFSQKLFSLVPVAYAAPSLTVDQPSGFKITDLGKLITSAISIALIFSGVLVFAFLVWGGVEWITSGGDKQKTESAKNRITAALVGLAIVAASWAIMKIISYFFGIDDFFNGSVNIPKGYGN